MRLLCSDGLEDRQGFDQITPALSATCARLGLQAMALPIRSVGVKADVRVYEHPVMLSGEAPWAELLQAAAAICEDVPGINRCIWNLGPQAPAAARPRAASVTRERLDLLREVDHLVMDGLERHGVYDQIWQCPTVAVPIELDGQPGELVVIRPVESERAMTAQAAPLPPGLIAELRRAVLSLPGISGLALDLTSKPPATIEWE